MQGEQLGVQEGGRLGYPPVEQLPMSPIQMVPRQTRCHVREVWLQRTMATSPLRVMNELAGGMRLAQPMAAKSQKVKELRGHDRAGKGHMIFRHRQNDLIQCRD